MTNRIDFFEPTNTELALPAASAAVFVDGGLCPYLEVLEITRAGWPDFGRARLAVNFAVYDGDGSTEYEFMENEIFMGSSISIQRFFNPVSPAAAVDGLSIFEGQLERIDTTFGAEGRSVEITAADYSLNMQRMMVYGRRIGNQDGTTSFLRGFDTVFNEDGRANATEKIFQCAGRSCRLFETGSSDARFWSVAEVIYYLLCENLPAGQLQIPALEQLESLTGRLTIQQMDVTGMSLLEALHHCCQGCGLHFKFVPRLEPAGPRQAIVFYKDRFGRSVELCCQKSGERLSISKTNIAGVKRRMDFWPVTHKYIGQGDFKVYEATFELVKAWDAALEDIHYDRFSPSTNPEFYKVRDVWRKWCLNEAGDYSGAPYNQGDAFDFSKIFETAEYVNRKRRFWPALTVDKKGRSLGYFLEVSYDDGVYWWQYLYAFDNLLDECGIWLSSDQLDVNTWVAALKGVLRFRITVSVVSDERLCCSAAAGAVDSAAPVTEHLFCLPGRFKYRKVSGKSIFAGSKDPSLGAGSEVDDTERLYQFVRQKAQNFAHTIGNAEIRTPYIALDYEPGDIVGPAPDGRDIFGLRNSRDIISVEQVRIDFKNQCTHLRISRRRRVFV